MTQWAKQCDVFTLAHVHAAVHVALFVFTDAVSSDGALCGITRVRGAALYVVVHNGYSLLRTCLTPW